MSQNAHATSATVPQPLPGELINYKDRDTWLASRADRVGASEVAILFGIAPQAWGSPYSMWLQKTGKLPIEPETEVEDWLRIGQLMEPVSAVLYEEKSGNRLWRGGNPFCVALHPKIQKFGCTPDGWIEIDHRRATSGPGLWQTKNAAWFMAHNWDEGIPEHVQVQEQAEMAITGAQWADVAVILGGNSFRWATVLRNDKMIAEIETQVQWFLDLVKSDTPPPIDGSEATKKALLRLHPNDDGTEVLLPEEAEMWWLDMLRAKARIKADDGIVDEAKNKIAAAIGGATFGRLPKSGSLLSFKHVTVAPFMNQGNTHRKLALASKKDLARKR